MDINLAKSDFSEAIIEKFKNELQILSQKRIENAASLNLLYKNMKAKIPSINSIQHHIDINVDLSSPIPIPLYKPPKSEGTQQIHPTINEKKVAKDNEFNIDMILKSVDIHSNTKTKQLKRHKIREKQIVAKDAEVETEFDDEPVSINRFRATPDMEGYKIMLVGGKGRQFVIPTNLHVNPTVANASSHITRLENIIHIENYEKERLLKENLDLNSQVDEFGRHLHQIQNTIIDTNLTTQEISKNQLHTFEKISSLSNGIQEMQSITELDQIQSSDVALALVNVIKDIIQNLPKQDNGFPITVNISNPENLNKSSKVDSEVIDIDIKSKINLVQEVVRKLEDNAVQVNQQFVEAKLERIYLQNQVQELLSTINRPNTTPEAPSAAEIAIALVNAIQQPKINSTVQIVDKDTKDAVIHVSETDGFNRNNDAESVIDRKTEYLKLAKFKHLSKTPLSQDIDHEAPDNDDISEKASPKCHASCTRFNSCKYRKLSRLRPLVSKNTMHKATDAVLELADESILGSEHDYNMTSQLSEMKLSSSFSLLDSSSSEKLSILNTIEESSSSVDISLESSVSSDSSHSETNTSVVSSCDSSLLYVPRLRVQRTR